MRFRKKPVEIEAVQFTGDNWQEIAEFVGYDAHDDGQFLIRTLEGDMRANPADWIIRGVKGEFYPCEASIFELTYEPVTSDQSAVSGCGCPSPRSHYPDHTHLSE